jgi:hypothetical protein
VFTWNPIRLTGFAEPHQSQTYIQLPFDVPDEVVRLDVSYAYTDAVGSDPHLTDGNTVDIGIFDPRGDGFMTDGFRGWSGSARSSFFIAHKEATPGYLAGLIQPGMWSICLGLYKIAPQGCEYHIEITLTLGESADEREFPALLPLRSSAGQIKPDAWYCGEMHCHTYHSDGDSDPLEVVRHAESLGLDFLAITDHNVLSHLARLNAIETPLILIPGFEVTTYKGHWNVWGDHGWIDFRVESEAQMAQAVAEASRRGYVISCNHPRPFGPEWIYSAVDTFDCIEVWNGPWQQYNHIALEFWESRLRAGKRYTAVGGSDSHFHHRQHDVKLAQPTLWIYYNGELSSSKLLDALRAGHVTISESPSGARLTLNVGNALMGDSVTRPENGKLTLSVHVLGGLGDLLELHTAAGCVERETVQADDVWLDFHVDVSATPYVRAQLVENRQQNTHIRALTNPIYIG